MDLLQRKFTIYYRLNPAQCPPELKMRLAINNSLLSLMQECQLDPKLVRMEVVKNSVHISVQGSYHSVQQFELLVKVLFYYQPGWWVVV